MYRYLIPLTILLLTLTACGKDEPAQVHHNASLAQAIANQPVIKQPQPEPGTPSVTETVSSEQSIATNTPTSIAATNTEAADTIQNQKTIDELTTNIVTVGLKNKFGEVLLPHRMHAEIYYCSTCHATNPPGKIVKTKKEFHALCRKCHAQLKQGPTKCRSCHHR